MERLRRLVSAEQPVGLAAHLTGLPADQPFIPGTTARSLAPTAVRLPSGLYVPAGARVEQAPIDLITTYLTCEEVVGERRGLAYALRIIAAADREGAIELLATWIAERQALEADHVALDRQLAARVFADNHRDRVLGLLGTRRVMLSPQGLLIAAKSVLQLSGQAPDWRPDLLVLAILALQEDLVASDGAEGRGVSPGGALFRELVRSQHFHAETYPRMLVTSHQSRWRDLPPRLRRGRVELPAEFGRATGVPLDDFIAVGFAVWSRVSGDGHPVVVPAGWMSTFRWEQDRLARALALFSTDAEDLAERLGTEERELGIPWSFDALRRFPVIRRPDGSLLIVSSRLLIERIFGWLPIFDLCDGLEAAGDHGASARALTCLRDACELQAMDSLRGIVGQGPARRLYDEDDLRRAFGGGRTSDAVVDAGEALIVVEVSTRHLQRHSRAGDSRVALEEDLERGIYRKAEQLESTIQNLVQDEARLTGAPPVRGRRFVPVLVIADGFPVNPMTTDLIERELRSRNLLMSPLVGRLRIIDQEELEMIESLTEDGTASLLGLLDRWAHSALSGMDMRTWMLAGRYHPGTPMRLEDTFTRAFRPIATILGMSDDELTDG
jgi:hypothetical protein